MSSVVIKVGMLALEREITPMTSTHAERQDNTYERHGTPCLIASLDVATGEILSPTIQETRKEEDFKNHIKATIDNDPEAEWVIVVDQLC